MTPAYLAVKDFARFQHYRDRRPPWIKLYATVLTDLDFVQLPEAAQAQLVKLWVLASQMGHPLPNNPKLLAGQIGATGRFYLPELIVAGFIIPLAESGGNASSGASRLASNGASSPLADSLAKSSALAGADARSRQSSEGREQRTEHRTRSSTRESSNGRSGPLSGERARENPAPPFASLREVRSAAPDVDEFIARFYGAATSQRRTDVKQQLMLTLTADGAKFKRGTARAGSLERLAAKCREVLQEGVRDPDKAIVVLLTKLNDSTDVTAVAVAAEHHQHASDNAARTRELFDACSWIDEHPDVAEAVAAQLARDFDGLEANDVTASARRIARESLVLAAYRTAHVAPDPEAAHA